MVNSADYVANLRESIQRARRSAQVCVPPTCTEWAEGFTAAMDWVLQRLAADELTMLAQEDGMYAPPIDFAGSEWDEVLRPAPRPLPVD